jgi:N-acetylmuramoyl-L-alanine amidase
LRRERGITEISFLKALASILAAVLVAGLLAAMAFAPGTAAQDFGCRGDIVLDPGHGGSDTGAVNKAYNLKESEEVLKVANILKGLLVEDGYAVCMTRTTNAETLSNNDRYTYANSTGARILVSIHMNGSTNPATDYTTTLFGKWRKDKELAYEVFEGLSTLPAASGTGTIATRTPYSFASGVLLKSNMPATIAETVFITNDKEAALLSDSTGTRQQQIAGALRTGIKGSLSTR